MEKKCVYLNFLSKSDLAYWNNKKFGFGTRGNRYTCCSNSMLICTKY